MKKKIFDENIILAVIAPTVTAVILLIVYAVKGIYPFGNRNISYFDLSQSIAPIYYHTYDFFHGKVDAFWDWYSAGGQSMVDTAGGFIFSPFNLFFLFIKRSQILNAMSLFLMLKICVSAGTMSFYFRKTFSYTSPIWSVLAGVLYASSGFTIQYYTNMHFLDIVAIFPIIIYFVDQLMKKQRSLGYIIFMTLGFIINFYLMVMVGIYLVMYAYFNIRKEEKVKGKKIGSLLGCATVLSFGLSSAITVPTLIALLSSSRTEVTGDSLPNLLPKIVYNHGYENKMLMLYGCELPLALLIAYIMMNRKNLKNIKIFSKEMFMFAIVGIPIWSELTNIIWHVGSYVEFPMRFGYMLTFTGLLLMGKVLQQRGKTENKTQNLKWLKYFRIPAIACLPFMCISMYYFMNTFTKSAIRDTSYYPAYWSAFVLLILVFLFAIISQERIVIVIVCSFLAVLQAGMGWYGFLAPEEEHSVECTDNIIWYTESIKDMADKIPESRINRVKDISVTLNANYPLVFEQSSLSNWTLGAKPALRKLTEKLGYSTDYTRILDNGGTVFSDALMHVTNTISKEESTPELVRKTNMRGDYIYSSSLYTYPFGILISKDIEDWSTKEDSDCFETQNSLFQAINKSDQSLIQVIDFFEIIEEEHVTEDETYEYFCKMMVEDKSAIYIQNTQDEDNSNYYTFKINGTPMNIPILDDVENYVYPGNFDNGLLYCGTVEDKIVEIEIESLNPIKMEEIKIGLLNLSLLQESIENQKVTKREVVAGKKNLQITLYDNEADGILIPIGFDSSTKVSINGKKVKTVAVANKAMYFVPLERGMNIIKMTFWPAGMNVGLVITAFSIIILILFYKFQQTIIGEKGISICMNFLISLFAKCILIFMYIIPVIITVIAKIWFKIYVWKMMQK